MFIRPIILSEVDHMAMLRLLLREREGVTLVPVTMAFANVPLEEAMATADCAENRDDPHSKEQSMQPERTREVCSRCI